MPALQLHGMGHIGTLKKQAKRGHAWAQYYLGQRFLSGKRGAVQSDHDALRWIQKAAGQGHPFAFWRLGLWHQDGAAFCKRDLSIAAKYAEKILNADPRLVDYAGDLMASIALEYICDERFDEAIATLQPLSERGVSGAHSSHFQKEVFPERSTALAACTTTWSNTL